MGCHEVRPLLPARSEELGPLQLRLRAEHLVTCTRCSAEAAAYARLGRALEALAQLEANPPAGMLDDILAALQRRHGAGSRVAAIAASSAGAVLVTVVVARAVRARRHTARRPPRTLPPPVRVLAQPALARVR